MTDSDAGTLDDSRSTHSQGRLERLLRAGAFVVTAETTPPVSADPAALLEVTEDLRDWADAVNVTDSAGAKSHMASLAAASLLMRAGIEPVLQFTVRDRNRIALQNDLLGAGALGISNILCLTGDNISAGDQPDAKMVMDLDSRGLVSLARDMRDSRQLPTGRPIEKAPGLFIGATDSPQEPDNEWSATALQSKVDAGAEFFQTQFCFDIDLVRRYMERLENEGVLERAYFLIGIGPIASAKSARWMNQNLFGVDIPESLIGRLEQATNQQAEGRRVCLELIQQLREVTGVSGVHLMGPQAERSAAQVIADSGILNERTEVA